jgi:hypothetical protein
MALELTMHMMPEVMSMPGQCAISMIGEAHVGILRGYVGQKRGRCDDV